MLRVLPVLIALVLLVYCLVDLAQSRSDRIRALPRWAWALVITFLPYAGPLGWLTFGRPVEGGTSGRPALRPGQPLAPDDDPEFLARLARMRQKSEDDRLRQWQADLERRERELGRDEGEGPGPTGSARA
ncbi:PLD nuclease N-terminal domain-containing protein [Actinopolymorpha singaporensis]|uniref:Phospholipase_D-nuclease N-terminal n=1 Tax=Actinopolymorpha singaporensis TaxID=117157 RepID=A0A1H1QPQ9_9ACTN|nr:PLD nuclease N-terminal domain-containing protein [Actinopolymorpha singaporensis]SDS25461.1 Phospholipase_D-nuclease N-terminal [Actinopolymorpha singaporensis]